MTLLRRALHAARHANDELMLGSEAMILADRMPGPTGSDPARKCPGYRRCRRGEAWAAGAAFSTTGTATAFIAHHTP
jgi:hypothetical protein